MKPKLPILCFFFILIGSSNGNSEPINLECEFTYHEFATVQKQYTCFVKNDLNISTPNVSILNVLGNHTENKTIDDVKALVIESKVTEYLPANIGDIFTNLIVLKVKNGRLKEIIKEDLNSMPKLKYLNLDDNDIQVLHDDVFEFNPQLELLWLSGNKIEHIGENLVENFKKLFSLYLTDNICTNKKFSLINSNHASLDASSTNRHVQNKFKTLSDIMQDCANFTQNILPVDINVNEDDSPKLKVYKEQIKSLDSQLVSTKSELKSLKLKFIDEMSAKNLTIDKLNELKREENEVDTGRMEELENKLKKEEKEMRNLKDELKKFKGIKDEFNKLKSTVKSYEEEKHELSSQIEQDQVRMRELEAQIARLREENESLKKLVPKTDIENEIDGQATTKKSTSGDNVEYEFIPLTASTTTVPSRQPETKESVESVEDTTIYDYYS